MKETLKKLYSDHYVEPNNDFDFKNYYYFLDRDYQIFGLFKDILTNNELELILSQYSLLSEDIGYQENKLLIDFLLGKGNNPNIMKKIKYYFIKYLHINTQETINELDDLLHELFSDEALFLKLQNIYVIIVNDDNDIQFTDSLKSIESDFFIPIIGYESDTYDVNDNLPNYFQFDYTNFKIYNKKNKLIINKTDLIENSLLSGIDNKVRRALKSYILKEFIHDTEMLNVIRSYFNTNFNLTLAAKNSYMHRNTFINKIDRFIQITNFNIREYHEAMIVYLALLL